MKVSVIVATFDRADLLPRTLASIARQSHRDVEVLVVDDGSSDETDRVVHEISASFPFLVRYFRQPHRGGAAARNHGARAASGDALAFLHAGDEWSADALTRLVHALETPGIDFACGATSLVEASDGETVPPLAVDDGPEISAEALFESPSLRCSATLLRSNAFDALGGFDEQLHAADSCDFLLRLAIRHRGARVDGPVVRAIATGGLAPAAEAAFLHGLLASAEKVLEREPEFAAGLGSRADDRIREIGERLLHCLILSGELRAAQRLAHRMRPLRDRWKRLALALGRTWPYTLALWVRAARRRWFQARPGA